MLSLLEAGRPTAILFDHSTSQSPLAWPGMKGIASVRGRQQDAINLFTIAPAAILLPRHASSTPVSDVAQETALLTRPTFLAPCISWGMGGTPRHQVCTHDQEYHLIWHIICLPLACLIQTHYLPSLQYDLPRPPTYHSTPPI